MQRIIMHMKQPEIHSIIMCFSADYPNSLAFMKYGKASINKRNYWYFRALHFFKKLDPV